MYLFSFSDYGEYYFRIEIHKILRLHSAGNGTIIVCESYNTHARVGARSALLLPMMTSPRAVATQGTNLRLTQLMPEARQASTKCVAE